MAFYVENLEKKFEFIKKKKKKSVNGVLKISVYYCILLAVSLFSW